MHCYRGSDASTAKGGPYHGRSHDIAGGGADRITVRGVRIASDADEHRSLIILPDDRLYRVVGAIGSVAC